MSCTTEPSRAAALAQLERWLPKAKAYSYKRNFVKPGYQEVSCLSPALRHRLVTETEVANAAIAEHGFDSVEKFVQEVYWRRYWKSWLSLRPQVWTSYLDELDHARTDDTAMARAVEIEQGQSAISIMAHFATELVETGYLHNHARMWFAAYWIHHERLPWQLGADFFQRYLLDGDPASNTLSWRWVAGWQTPGKTYLARKSNLEKYLHPELIERHGEGLELLSDPEAVSPGEIERPLITLPELPQTDVREEYQTGLWIHEDDLNPESAAELTETIAPSACLVTSHRSAWHALNYSSLRQRFIEAALKDAESRARDHFGVPTTLVDGHDLVHALLQWANDRQLQQIIALRPEVGPLNDALPVIHESLEREGVRLCLIDRHSDLQIRPLATKGFFGFWKKLRKEF